eukprot:TRINITY_DN21077_c0_g1_i1.p2 TRINITY_DN21077_c0_g1~~TRINITY_DN21077_c0_g1_i1.p2  ORF type:complete len:127 (-),score=13.25 TRINITY_DN21077_c0_g1_i1:90-470(-)
MAACIAVSCRLVRIFSINFFFFLMLRRPPRSTHCISSAASDVYKRQVHGVEQTISNLSRNFCFAISVLISKNTKLHIICCQQFVIRLINMICKMSFDVLIHFSFSSGCALIQFCLLYTSPSPRDQA